MHVAPGRQELLAAADGSERPGAGGGIASPAGLLGQSSLELSTRDRDAILAAAAILPPRMEVYVPKLPRRAHTDALDPIRRLHEAGFQPVPHIAARDLVSARELEDFVRTVVRVAGTDRVLVIGGDSATPAGPFADCAAVIASGILDAAGIRRLDVAGYPDGHPHIAPAALRSDMARRIELAAERNLQVGVITQFCFAAGRIADYCAVLAQDAPGVPVRAGVVGPTSARRLLHFARVCGVSTSLRALGKLGLDSLRLVMDADPDRQLDELARRSAAGTAGHLAGIHLFTFGGFPESAAWFGRNIRRPAI